jgi:hypothetical protein
VEGRIDVIFDDDTLQQSGEDWCDGDGLIVGGESGVGTLGIGRIEAAFHCLGTMDVDKDRFIMALTGPEKNGAPIRRNQAGMLSNPVAVDGRVSSNLNIRHSEM